MKIKQQMVLPQQHQQIIQQRPQLFQKKGKGHYPHKTSVISTRKITINLLTSRHAKTTLVLHWVATSIVEIIMCTSTKTKPGIVARPKSAFHFQTMNQ